MKYYNFLKDEEEYNCEAEFKETDQELYKLEVSFKRFLDLKGNKNVDVNK